MHIDFEKEDLCSPGGSCSINQEGSSCNKAIQPTGVAPSGLWPTQFVEETMAVVRYEDSKFVRLDLDK